MTLLDSIPSYLQTSYYRPNISVTAIHATGYRTREHGKRPICFCGFIHHQSYSLLESDGFPDQEARERDLSTHRNIEAAAPLITGQEVFHDQSYAVIEFDGEFHEHLLANIKWFVRQTAHWHGSQ